MYSRLHKKEKTFTECMNLQNLARQKQNKNPQCATEVKSAIPLQCVAMPLPWFPALPVVWVGQTWETTGTSPSYCDPCHYCNCYSTALIVFSKSFMDLAQNCSKGTKKIVTKGVFAVLSVVVPEFLQHYLNNALKWLFKLLQREFIIFSVFTFVCLM